MGDREACDECKQNCSLMHGGKKDPSPLVTTFHKILFGDYDFSKDLCLPRKISKIIPDLVAGENRILEDTNGRQWQVALGTKDGHLAFREGWDTFFADHGLREGYILAFHYIMTSHFVVKIADNTGFEKLNFPVANGKKRKRSKIDGNCDAVGEGLNLSNNLTNKKGSAFSGSSDSEAIIHSQPMSKDNPGSFENGNCIYQHVASADCDPEFYMINRDAGYNYEEDRSPLLDFLKCEMQIGVDPDGSSDRRTCPANTSAESIAIAGILNKNSVSAKVVSGEPGEVAALTFCNNDNITSKRDNVAEVDNDHHGDHPSVVPIGKRAQVPSEHRIKRSTASSKRVKFEEATASKKHSTEIVKLPKTETMELGKSPCIEFPSSEKYPKFNTKPEQIFGGAEKKIEVRKVVKTEPVDSYNGDNLDASALSFTVMVRSSELLELPTSVTLWACVEKKVVHLKGPDNRVWPVLYHQKLGVKALTSGWENFFMLYKLQIGHECAFTLEKDTETIFRIDVKSK